MSPSFPLAGTRSTARDAPGAAQGRAGCAHAYTAPSSGRRARAHLCRHSIKCWDQGLRRSSEANTPSRTRDSSRACCATQGFGNVVVSTVEQTIVFPSVLDYVRFQILATPMTVLLKGKTEPERQAVISSVASKTATLSTPAMCAGGKFTFRQEAYVAIGRNAL